MVKQTQEEREQKREEKQAYLKRKKVLVPIELNNYDRIIIFRGTNNYWMIDGHSAIIFANKIGPEIGIRRAVKHDTDYDYKFEDGVISIQSVDYYISQISSTKLIKKTKKEEDVITFFLANKISETEYRLLLRSKELKRQKLEEMIIKSRPMPQVIVRTEEVFKTGFRLYKKYTEPATRTILSERLVDQLRTAHKMVLLVAREDIKKYDALIKVRTTLSRAMVDVMQLSITEAWSIGDYTAISTQLISSINAIDTELKEHSGDKPISVLRQKMSA